jgi:hypothetical protein
MVCLERSSGNTKFYFFDEKWELKRLNIRGKNAPEGFTIPKPECMDKMFKMIQEHSTDLQEMAAAYISAEQANAEVAQSLSSDVIV